MKISKLALVSIVLLAVLTIGAVSASQNVDNMAVTETGGDDLNIDESPGDEILSSESNAIVIGDNGNSTFPIDDFDPIDNGNSTNPIDDDDPIDDGDDPIDDDGDDPIDDGGDDPVDEEGYDVHISNSIDINNEYSEICSYVFYGDFKGTVAIILDGVEVYNETAESSCDIYMEDLNIGDITYGNHELKFIYSGDENHSAFTYNETVDFTYRFNVIMDELSEYLTVVPYGINIEYMVDLPSGATGSIVYTINGKQYVITADDLYELDYYIIISNQDVVYECNNLTFTYVGDDYPSKTIYRSFDCRGVVRFSDEIPFDGTLKVSLLLPEDANGILEVYEKEGEWIWDGDDRVYVYNLTLLDSRKVENGTVNMEIPDLSLGYHMLDFNFTGDYAIEVDKEFYDSAQVHVVSKMEVPSQLWINGTYDVEFALPKEYNGNLTVTIGEEIKTFSVVDGKATFELFNLEYYDDWWEENERISYVYYSYVDNEMGYSFTNYWKKLSIILTDPQSKIRFNDNDYYQVLVKDRMDYYVFLRHAENARGNVSVYVDGELYSVEDIYWGELDIYIKTENLTVGKHDVRFEYSGDDYFMPSTLYDSFNVTFIDFEIPQEVTIGKYYYGGHDNKAYVTMSPGATGEVKLSIDGKEIEIRNVDGFENSFDLSNLTYGNHTVTLTYQNGNYPSFTKTSKVEAKYRYAFDLGSLIYGSENAYVELPIGATGTVIATIDGKQFSATIDEKGIARFNIAGITAGEYNATVTYAGDDVYPAASETSEISIYYHIIENFDDEDEIYCDDLANKTISLTLPEDASGKLVIYNRIWDELVSKNLVNGKALITLKEAFDGIDVVGNSYRLYFVYDGEDYDVNRYSHWIKINDYKVIHPQNQINLGDTVNYTVQFSKNVTGYLKVLTGRNYKTVMLDNVAFENGVATISFEASTMGITEFKFVYVGDDYKFEEYGSILVWPENITLNDPASGDDDLFTIKMPSDASGKLTVYVYNSDKSLAINSTYNGSMATVKASELSKGNWILSSFIVTDEKYGTFSFYTTGQYYGNGFYDTFDIIDSAQTNLINPNLTVSADDINVGDDVTINVSLNETITGEVTVTVGGTPYTVDVVKGTGSKTISNLAAGSYDVTASYAGDDVFRKAQKTASFTVNKLSPRITINSLDRVVEGSNLTVTVVIPSATGSVIVNGKEYDLTEGKADATITNVETGVMTISVSYSGDNNYLASSANKTVTVYASNDPNLQITVDDISAGESAVVNVVINEAVTGEVTVNGTAVTITNGKGSVSLSNLAVGQYTVTAVFAGDEKFIKSNATASFKVNKAKLSSDVISAPSEAKTPTFAIAAPADATGSLRVIIGGKSYTAQLADGSASIVISDLSLGSYEATITYSGDAKYDVLTKNVTVSVITDPKITAKATSVLYTANGKFQVTVYGKDGKLASGVEVIFKIAGKQVGKATTNANGVATYTVKNVPGTYTVSATALAKTASAKLTVKHLVTLKSVTVKKSAKKLVLQATLSKVNGKYLKNKQIAFKFNGKTYKAKTSSKGVAKVTIKSTVLNKLKVGKKITYQATYLKDTVKKTVKVKK